MTTTRRYQEELKKLFLQVETIKTEWERSMDCVEEMVVIADENQAVKRCNQTFRDFVGKPYNEILGRNWTELLRDKGMAESDLSGGSEIFHRQSGQWYVVSRNFYRDAVPGTVVIIAETTQRKRFTEELERKNRQIEVNLKFLEAKNRELEEAHAALKASQAQMIHQEKMASIGQLAAGTAHEINNPIGFITSNLATLGKYVERLTDFICAQSEALRLLQDGKTLETLQEKRKSLKVDFIVDDISALISQSLDGANRVHAIVRDLKSFSRADEQECTDTDVNECIGCAVNIVWNELKYKVALKKELGHVQPVKCHVRQLNQVFMNLLVNAAQSIEKQGEITIRTWMENSSVCASVSDTGCGIPDVDISRIFEPFFTTKEDGKGTGLGLSISFEIIKKHGGEIFVSSEQGKGSTFTVRLPVAGEVYDGK